MDEAAFWKLIDQAKAGSNGNIDEQLRILLDKLAQLPASEIIDYQRVIDTLRHQAYTWDLWAAGYILNGGCSNDGFDYFRGWLIAQGKEVYYDSLRDPETLADLALPDDELECEELLTIAWSAYEAKTGQEFPYDVMLTWRVGKSEPSGERWDEDTVGDKYPKLAAASHFWMSDKEWEAKKSTDNSAAS